MALQARLEMRQGQQLVMTPQLQQAIRLLQYSNTELTAYVESELERNPILERDEEGDAVSAVERSEEREAPAAETDAGEWLDLDKGSRDATDAFDTAAENVFPDQTRTEAAQDRPGATSGWETVRTRTNNDPDQDGGGVESLAGGSISLKEHLTEQLNLALRDGGDRLIGLNIIDLVDEAGYLQGEVGDIADKLGCGADQVARVLAAMQGFEPAGVCARTLGECLALQLKEQNRYDAVIARLLDNLHLLGGHNIAALKRAVGVDADELGEMIREIKGLNPKPGLAYGSVDVQPVLPDVLVRPASDGSWAVELNSDTLPRVLVNRSYYTLVSKHTRSTVDKTYLIDCLQSANWLVKSLDQRARTILKVAEEVVRQQDGFLTHGVQHMRPLNLKTVADKIGMHESTVSRVTSNKYIATPRGIFELKYFFTSSIAAADGDGEAHSSEAVRHRIRQLIDGESSQSVLSDDRIVELLRHGGIDIARRTVAKYRELMRIASSVQRRREKVMQTRLDNLESVI